MPILVTGGTGFIGSHLCSALLANGEDVVAIGRDTSRLSTQTIALLKNKNFRVVQHDITSPLAIKADKIYNLASPASPMQHKNDPIQTLRTNFLGTMNVLNLAVKLDIPIFQASTGEVYGDPEIHPQTEQYWGNVNPLGERACYTESKRVAETLFDTYQREHHIPVRIARLFSSYGPGMALQNGRVISTFINQALHGEPITIFGDGSQTRSFCYVSDIVSGIVSMMQRNDAGLLGPINLGSSREISLTELAELIIGRTQSKSKIKYIPTTGGEPRQLLPSIDRAKLELGWEPLISLEEGIDLTIDSFRRGLQ